MPCARLAVRASAGVPTLAKFPDGDGGVHDVLLDPQFATNRIVYFTTYEIVPGQVIEPSNPDRSRVGSILC